MSATPTGLLRNPASLSEQLEQPLEDQLRRRNRYRKPEATAVIATAGNADPITMVPVLSEDSAGLSIMRTRTTEAGRATIVGLADREPNARLAPPMVVYINGETPRFAGRVTSAQRTAPGVLSVTAFDAMRQLKRATFSGSYDEVSVGQIAKDILSSVPVQFSIQDRFFALDQIEQEGEPIERGYQRIVEETGESARSDEETTASGPTAGDQPGEAERTYLTVTQDYSDANVAQAIEDLAKWANAEWWVSQTNVVHFAKKFAANELTLNGVRTSKAGTEAPPVRKVVVKGGPKSGGRGESAPGGGSPGGGGGNRPDPGGSAGGRTRRTNRTSKVHYRGVAGDENAPRSQTYVTTERGANSQQMAQGVADVLWREIQRRTAAGSIAISGRAAPRPLDKIRLPEYVDGTDKGYIVSEVSHRISSDDGYVTTITPGGDPERTFAESSEQSESEQSSGATGWGDGATEDAGQPYPDIPGGGAH